MPRLYPSEPIWLDDNGAERHVWEKLRDALPDDAAIFHGVRVQDGAKDREIDLLIAWPGVGLAVIEVKGGHISREGGGWRQSDRSGTRRIDPLRQVQDARHSLQRQLRGRGLRVADAPTAHLVAFPWSVIPSQWDSIDLPRTMVLDRTDHDQPGRLADRVMRAVRGYGDGNAVLDEGAVEQLIDLVAAELTTRSDVVTAAEQHDTIADQLTRDQKWVLDILSQQRRAKITGAAGAGKTWLALEKAHRLARAGERVALMCYSRGLGKYFQRVVSGWPRRERPAYVGLFHELPLQWGAPTRDDGNSDWWETGLPDMLGDLASQRDPSELFDSVVVDEGQDFGAAWWTSLLRCLREPSGGGLFVFMDEDQRVFPRRGEVPIELPPFPLNRSIRSTKPIARTFGALTDTPVEPFGAQGEPVRIVDVPESGAVSAADDAVEALMDEGWRPGQIAVLTTGRRHPVQRMQIEADGYDSYWAEYFDDQDVFYGTVLNFKGLERSVVVLAVNGIHAENMAKRVLYTGMSRAKSLLVVVGDRAEIERIGGSAAVNRLAKAHVWHPGRL